MTTNPTVFEFLAQLKAASIFYTLASVRDDAIMFKISVPGARWEVEFFSDGSVEVEVFLSNGEIYDHRKLDELFRRFSD
jgi:hypothetical protein